MCTTHLDYCSVWLHPKLPICLPIYPSIHIRAYVCIYIYSHIYIFVYLWRERYMYI